jgi:hypothetical protein
MSLEQTIGNLEIRYANVVTFVGSSNTMVDTTTGRIQTKGFQHNSNVITDISGPHGRIAPTLKKYPEIAFESGKFDSNDSTNTYVQAGYTVSASRSQTAIVGENLIWEAFNGIASEIGMLLTGNNYDNDGNANTTGTTASRLSASDSTPYGEWLKLKLPNKIKLNKYVFTSRNDTTNWTQSAEAGQVWGSDNDSDWVHLHTFTSSGFTGASQTASFNVTTNNYYKYYAFIVTKTFAAGTNGYLCIPELEYYGYEEDPPAGDHSVDTTFKSRFNNPQLTGVQVLVDGATGVGTNQISGGPDPSGNDALMTSPNKYWTLNGTLTSNLAVEANTFLEGDQPHAVSVWFNSSNLEANVSNTCVFSISDQEHLNSQNLDLQSNTWHNLTYAYQGEGGSKVTYLDGRKVSEDRAEDTFGDYPPFAMTGYSQGGYVVSESTTLGGSTTDYLAWWSFNSSTTTPATGWISIDPAYNGSSYIAAVTRNLGTDSGGAATVDGEYIILEMPHSLRISYANITHRSANTDRSPASGRFYGSNDGINWEEIKQFSGITTANYAAGSVNITINSNKYYKRVALVPTGIPRTSGDWVGIGNLEYYGHRENDLVRLPDPANVLKYPHIAMRGPAQRGYVAKVSSQTSTTADYPYRIFDGDDNTQFRSAVNTYTSGTANTTDNLKTQTSAGGTATINGSWVSIELPHKLILQSTRVVSNDDTSHVPERLIIYGSNDITNDGWTEVDTTYKSADANIPHAGTGKTWTTTASSTGYKNFALAVSQIESGTGNNRLVVSTWELYGTGVDSVPIQIGGGNIDKVANFRVYDKFIGEDQALEIWDAQKEEFGRAKPQMVLQQGKLGIGTDAPQGSLSVADEPDPTTYGLQEFPPKPLAGNKTYFEGHGEFCVSASSIHSVGRAGWEVFNKTHLATSISEGWISGYSPIAYNSSGVATGNFGVINGVNGEYLILESPYKIKMDHVLIYPRVHNSTTVSYSLPPKDGKIWGRNAIHEHWTEITSYTNLTYGATRSENLYGQIPTRVNINATQYYKYIAFQITATNTTYSYTGSALYTDYANLKELRYFGYREQVTKQSVLHDGQLTLTKNLTVPSIGPSVTNTRHGVPKRHNLVVEFDTSTNPTDLTTVHDTSGRGNDIIMYGNARYDAIEKAFRLDGTSGTYMSGTQNLGTGTPAHTITGWFKQSVALNNWTYVMFIGTSGTGQMSGMLISNTGQIVFDIYNTRIDTTVNASTGIWHHFAGVFKGGTSVWDNASTDLYINGQLEASAAPDSGTQYPFSLTGNGIQFGSSTNFNRYFNGSISQFKLYNTALTAGDVKTLYDMGRGDSYHVTNFQNTLVGINLGNGRAPRSALDVRDQIYARTSTIGTFTGQHICFPDESMEKGLVVSAKKNQFVKLNGLAIGKSAITIDESLPIVSLSNVAQDKACFGVVSKMEESNEAYRTEITGGLVSESIKIAGDNRAIVNSVGEGAIWVVDTNGPLESGDYITTSNVAGYGQKQDDDVLHNFTVAKITMDCDFTGSNVAVQTIKREQTGTRTITEDAWNQLVEYDRYSNVEDEITTYYQIQRGGNVLDENGQLQFEDKTGATEEPYERRFLTADGSQTDEANTVHTAAFVGCTYHCG